MTIRNFASTDGEPVEVRLVGDVTTCRTCKWFWEKPPYGPFPSFGFVTDFPPGVLERPELPAPREDEPADWLRGPLTTNYVDPQILHGCRKAPIMTIGINPNLTGFWPGTKGARWAYPWFGSLQNYAYYYRHRTLYQESVPLDTIRDAIESDGRLLAEGSGRVTSTRRDMAARKISIRVRYDDDALGDKEYSVDWSVDRRFALLFDRADPASAAQFESGDMIAGFLRPELPDGQVRSELVGYYQRFVPILDILEAHLRAGGLRPTLRLGEDVSQLDMVACASPGWGSVYEIDKSEVERACVQEHAWALKQLVQSQPAIIVFSGRSAYELFHSNLPELITPAIDPEGRETYDLLATTTRWPHYLTVDATVGGRRVHFRARVVIAPHFSYDDNFVPHARFSPYAWSRFKREQPQAAAALDAAGAVLKPSRDGYVPIDPTRLHDFQTAHPVAMDYVLRNFYEPTNMIASALVQESVLGNIRYDPDRKRLQRSAGPCRFCVNGVWEFPEGCAYGKPDEPLDPPRLVDDVVAHLLAGDTAQ